VLAENSTYICKSHRNHSSVVHIMTLELNNRLIKCLTYGVVDSDSVDRHEVTEEVLIRNVVAMPCHHIERRMILP